MSTPSPVQQPVTEAVLSAVAERAASIDRGGVDTDVALAELGRNGAFRAAARGDVAGVTALLETLARECFATAFSAWGHQMAILFHRAAGIDAPEELLNGSVAGVSAMAPAFKWASELDDLPVEAVRDGDSVVLNGTIVWASNLYPDAVVMMPVRSEDGAPTIARVRIGTEGLTVKPSAPLLALNGTASGSLSLHDVRIPASELTGVPLTEFLTAVRPGFLLAQTAFCIGLGARSLDEAASSAEKPGPNALFRDRLEALHETEQGLRNEHASLLEKVTSPVRLLRLRLDAAQFVSAATKLEATLAGGRGYLATADTTRRVREAAFLPVQSPTEGHLLWEIRRNGG